MAETATLWAPRGAWAGIAQAGQIGATGPAGVTATLLDGFGLATLIAAPGRTTALSQAVEGRLNIALPTTPKVVSNATHDAIWSGPEQWLLRAATRDGFRGLLEALATQAAVSDQSDARAAIRLSGLPVRDVLAKGVMLDLHPAAFAVSDTALTSIAHIGVHLWRLADGPDGSVFEIMVARSMVGSFWSWFAASAAEFGCRVSTGRG
ncbi:N-methylglutamate dehydrogenase subunit D [Bosea sp. 62]|uniref:sarcosine oxidase subunit gamma n=1 Tax=unclassified Bosea (in: a-proteobacteria) TaxID=2653178 RepID=UPI00125C1CF0|nr:MULTISPECIES: sarcosine oxidase subunit gamma family protein [unclassified Bosea (in: a-proteobacteria)]CAD5293450.1 N-methylglutamate dehydrogenase subunit D [Bosea sp. 21B]CAD5294001.1 N-methylglutamate dehydrogenase subunit D [Bosea sp. 46]CAD5299286.1 N-methylglutamate dehydrogenase subunit D [Bosea sp. 7B]VVT62157.1 N-methylglutamate dehydrogenase subunit D [Bosea sp. EC-HK365B]VXB11040.1 N-methylglutamate dehydrogenase subunit D [Bosea sp. 125]